MHTKVIDEMICRASPPQGGDRLAASHTRYSNEALASAGSRPCGEGGTEGPGRGSCDREAFRGITGTPLPAVTQPPSPQGGGKGGAMHTKVIDEMIHSPPSALPGISPTRGEIDWRFRTFATRKRRWPLRVRAFPSPLWGGSDRRSGAGFLRPRSPSRHPRHAPPGCCAATLPTRGRERRQRIRKSLTK
ncbi:hypothetical protein SAMN04515648_0391 [Phyllobacterium sp. CL33Tsu]|nr:hypothetical protein SAMN04515648_0391 [Phyllobacterium sp. CL33Tsu]